MYVVVDSPGKGLVVLHLPTNKVFNYKGRQVGVERSRRVSEFLTIVPEMALYHSKRKSKALRMANMYSVVL